MTCRIMFQLKPNKNVPTKKLLKTSQPCSILSTQKSWHPTVYYTCPIHLPIQNRIPTGRTEELKNEPYIFLNLKPNVKDLVLVIFPLSWFWSPDFFHFKGKESLRLSDRCYSLVWLEGNSFMAYHSFSCEESRFLYPGYTIMNIVEIRNTWSFEAEGVLINLWSIKNFRMKLYLILLWPAEWWSANQSRG